MLSTPAPYLASHTDDQETPPEDKNSQPNPLPYPGYPGPYVVYPQEEPIDWGVYWKIIIEQKKMIGIIMGVSTPYDTQGNTERGVYCLDMLQPAAVGI